MGMDTSHFNDESGKNQFFDLLEKCQEFINSPTESIESENLDKNENIEKRIFYSFRKWFFKNGMGEKNSDESENQEDFTAENNFSEDENSEIEKKITRD